MIAVIFELEPNDGQAQDYFKHAAELAPILRDIDGFLGVERFESVTTPGKFLSLSFFADETAVARWRNHLKHRSSQRAGRAEIFADYRLRVAQVIRDYGLTTREQAPPDSLHVHDEAARAQP